MAVLKYKDPTSGAVVTVGAPKVDTYSKGVIDNLLTNKANTDLSNVSASALSAAIAAAGAGAKIERGSYVGAGKYGSSNPNSLTFNFVPQMVIIVTNDKGGSLKPGTLFIRGQTESNSIGNYDNSAYSMGLVVSWSGNSVSWYTTENIYEDGNYNYPENEQLDYSGQTYYYIAFG